MYYGRSFNRRLKKVKMELLALKQAHIYGLNRTNFYYKSKTVTSSSSGYVNIRITITFKMTETEMPFYIVTDKIDTYGAGLWDSVNKKIIITGNTLLIQPYTNEHYVYVVSEKEILDITIEEI